MNDLTTLPSSVRYQLERAHEYAENGQMQAAERAVRDAMVALAHSSPDLCALLIAAYLGYAEITVDHIEKNVEETTTGKYLLGIRYAEVVTTVTKTKTTSRRLGLSGPRR